MSFLLTPSVLASAPPLFSSLVPPLLTPDAPEWCRPSQDSVGFSLCYSGAQDFAFVPLPPLAHPGSYPSQLNPTELRRALGCFSVS